MAKEKKSMTGKWDRWYKGVSKKDIGAFRYGDTETYTMAAKFLADIKEVEDWGCGLGGFKRFYKGKYIGIDGSKTPFTDKVVDLRTYKSNVEGVMMRHVLEHNYDWDNVLTNAVASFNKKMCLILFTPFSPKTHEIAHNLVHGVDVPDISFKRKDIEKHFSEYKWKLVANIPTKHAYRVEHVYFITKKSPSIVGKLRSKIRPLLKK
jgi:hypothetical protein